MLNNIYHFFRLIRTANLLVIALTMCVVEVFLLRYILPFQTQNILLYLLSAEMTNFTLLIVSTLLIAAAGNIINDYFDVKADRVNKPTRLIIGKYIKRRWAMVMHWSFNSLGMIIALYVGYMLQNVWVPLTAFLSINLLWFYSAYYKRKPLIGNLIVALLLGVIPVYVLVFNWPIMDFNFQIDQMRYTIPTGYKISVICFASGIAFTQNLVRELTKDIQDVRGDLKLGASTFPIKYGIRKTKWLVSLFSMLTAFAMVFFYIYVWNFDFNMKGATMGNGIDLNQIMSFNMNYFRVFLTLSLLFFIISFGLIISFNKSKTYKLGSLLLKFAMLFGLITPLFL